MTTYRGKYSRKSIHTDSLIVKSPWADVRSYGATGGGVTDDATAIQEAIDNSLFVFFPDGEYVIESTINLRDGLVLSGLSEIEAEGARGAKLICNDTTLFDTNSASRIKIALVNLWLVDNTDSGTGLTATGVNGDFGGTVEGCRFDNFLKGINNTEGFVTDYINNIFNGCDISIDSYTSNAVNVFRNTFTGAGRIYFRTDADAQALNFIGNTVNISTDTEVGFLTSGMTNIEGNYFESFGTPATDCAMIKHVTTQFELKSLNVRGNIMNGGTLTDYGIFIAPSAAARTAIRGTISNNWMAGFDESEIEFGTNNDIFGLNIQDNRNDGMTIGNIHASGAYKPLTNSSFTTVTDVSGGTFIDLPFGQTVNFSNVTAFTTTVLWEAPKAGVYRFSGVITMLTAGDLRNIELRVTKQGSAVFSCIDNITHQGAATYTTMPYDVIVSCADGDDIKIQARNGDDAHIGNFNAEWLRERVDF